MVLCAAFNTRLIAQSCDNDQVCTMIKEIHILVYDQQTELMALQQDDKINKSDTHVS